jgi:hypothetical protein
VRRSGVLGAVGVVDLVVDVVVGFFGAGQSHSLIAAMTTVAS